MIKDLEPISSGTLVFLFVLYFSLLSYLVGYLPLQYISFALIVVGLGYLLNSIIDDLKTVLHEKSYARIIVIFIIILYFILRLALSDFTFFTGDASSYLLSGINFVITSEDAGFFPPLTTAISAMGYMFFGASRVSLIIVIIYLFSFIFIYHLLRQLNLEYILATIFAGIYTCIPIVIWFSKATFSEPVWQVLVVGLILFISRLIEKEEVNIYNCLIVILILTIMPYSRGTAIFAFYASIFIITYYYVINLSKHRVEFFVVLLISFYTSLFFSIQLREVYMIEWQYSRVLSGISVTYLWLLLLAIGILIGGSIAVFSRTKLYFAVKIKSLLLLTLILMVKVIPAIYFYLKSDSTLYERLLGNELSFILEIFGPFGLLLIIVGISLMIYRAYSDDSVCLIILTFYAFMSVPFNMMNVDFDRAHAMIFYWSRYYYADIAIIHFLYISYAVNAIYIKLNIFIKSKMVFFVPVALIMLSINWSTLEIVTKEGYMAGSSEVIEWVEEVAQSNPVIVLYCDDLIYGPYRGPAFIGRSLSNFGLNIVDQYTLSECSPNLLTEILSENINGDELIVCLGFADCDLSNYGFLVDSRLFNIQWREHPPKTLAATHTSLFIPATVYVSLPKFNLNQQIEVKKGSRLNSLFLSDGWYFVERSHVWSSEQAELTIPVGDAKLEGKYVLQLQLSAYSASELRPVEVEFSIVTDLGYQLLHSMTLIDQKVHSVKLPISIMDIDENKHFNVRINVQNAASPLELGHSGDSRVLGIALHSIGLYGTDGRSGSNNTQP